MLAIDKEGNVTGYFEQGLGGDVPRTCAFFLKGRVAISGQFDIVSWSGSEDPVLPGIITKEFGNNDDIRITIKRGNELPGCFGVVVTPLPEGTSLSRNYETRWTNIKMIRKDRAYIYSEPSLKKKTKAYFIKDDVVGIIAANPEWVQVFYPRFEKSTIKGWLKRSDVDDLEPPPSTR